MTVMSEEMCFVNKLVYENLNGLSLPQCPGFRRGRLPPTSTQIPGRISTTQPEKNCIVKLRKSTIFASSVWEARSWQSRDEDDNLGPKTPSLNGYHNNLDPMHNYVNKRM